MARSGRKRRVLRTLVDIADGSQGAVAASRVAGAVEDDPPAARKAFESLRSYGFVKTAADGGYEPTITGREFLALDIDEASFVVVDAPDDPDRE